MKKSPPTIKGIFVMSHVNALIRAKGEKALQELVTRCGRRVQYGANEDVPVRTEIEIIENVLDMLAGKRISAGTREFEAGKLHFNNFAKTSLGEMVLMFSFRTALMRAPWIARRVFRGMEFSSKELDKKSVEIILGNNDYPLEHFQGFFKAWMEHLKLKGTVKAREKDDEYIYTIKWA
jgi:hypothetical protein